MPTAEPELFNKSSRTKEPPLEEEFAREYLSSRRAPDRRRAQRTILLIVAAAGARGALGRYGVASALPSASDGFPWSTFWINVSGSFAIGFVLALLARFPRARLARPLVVTGFLGGFTTFSTFVVEADLLVRAHRDLVAFADVAGSLAAGTAAVVAGLLLARLALRTDRMLDHHLGS